MTPSRELTAADWHRLNGLLAQALELEGEARTAWIDGLAEPDRHLRGLLTDLLAQSQATGFAEATAPPTTVANLAAAALSAMRREAAGDRIGPWRLERLLAEGGMGSVWRAERADGVMKRTAALKLPRAEWVDRGLTERIGRERAILARLQHPAIAVLYDAGLANGGRPYLALEYVDGVPIDAYCKGRSVPEVLRLMVQVIRAVAYAHGQLVIHRDLKPANVLVNADGQPKLLDFGISKLLEGDAPTVEETALTRLAGRPMTLAYAAPEQVLGQPITVAADVYALGVMLYELLAQAKPYRATSPRELEAEVLRGELRPPSEAASDGHRGRLLEGDLDAIVLTALKRQPSERYDSAAALADDLQRYLDGEPVKARPDSAGYRLRKFLARHKLPVAAGVAIVAALAVGLGVALWQANEARNQAARATALNTFVLNLIRTADPSASRETKAADVAMLNTVEQRIDNDFKGSPKELLQLRITMGEAYKNRGEMLAARRVFQKAADEAAPHLPPDDLLLLTAKVRAADDRLVVSTAAGEQLERAIAMLRGKPADDVAAAELLLDALLLRIVLAQNYGVPAYLTHDETTKSVAEVEALALSRFGAGSRQHLRAAQMVATLASLRHGAEAAGSVLAGALGQARVRGDALDSPEYLTLAGDHARYRCHGGQVPAGLGILWQLNDAVKSAHGSTSYLLESVYESVAECLSRAGDPTAFGWMMDAYEIAAAREQPPSTNLMRRAAAAFNWAAGARDFEAAERLYLIAVDNARAFPEDAIRERATLGLRNGRVCQLTQRGDAEEAVRVAEPLIAYYDKAYAKFGRLTPDQGGIWICTADAMRQLGRYDEAIAISDTFAERCIALRRIVPTSDCAVRAYAMRALAQLDAGRVADAIDTMKEHLAGAPLPERDPRTTLTFSRVLLASGRSAEAAEVLRENYGRWLSMQPGSPYAAEALYWFGRAYLAVGDKRGRWMVEQARQQLVKSPVAPHRRLAAGDAVP